MEAEGKLLVTVVKARAINLQSTQLLNGKFTDIFCTVEIENQKQKTKLVSKDVLTWENSFSFNITKPFGVLEVEVYTGGFISAEKFLGRATVNLVDISDQKPKSTWLVLRPRTLQDELVEGELQLQLQYKYKPVWETFYKAAQSIRDKNFNLALRLLDESIVSHPDWADLYSQRSRAYLGLGKVKEALADAQKVIELNPNSAEGYYRIGVIYYQYDEFEDADKYFSEGLKYEPSNYLCVQGKDEIKKNELQRKLRQRVKKGRGAFEKGEYTLATSYFKDTIDQNPGNCNYYVFRALTHLAQNNIEKATEDALKIISLKPDWPRIDPVKTGYLAKEGKVNFLMKKKRWFVLKESFIYYYDTFSDLKANGVILLHPGFDLGKNGKKELFIITEKRIFSLEADSQKERDDWLSVLEKYLNRKKLELPPPDPSEEKIMPEAALPAFTPVNLVTGVINSSTSLIAMPFTVTQKVMKDAASKIIPKTVNIENVKMEGFLHKAGEINTSFQQRYWTLIEKTLYYFKDPVKPKSSVSPAGAISLENCKVEVVEKPIRQYSFELKTPARTYLLSADSEHEMRAWIDAIISVTDEGTQSQLMQSSSVQIDIPVQVKKTDDFGGTSVGSLKDHIVDSDYEGKEDKPKDLVKENGSVRDIRKSMKLEQPPVNEKKEEYLPPRIAVRRQLKDQEMTNVSEEDFPSPETSAEDRLWSNYKLKPPEKKPTGAPNPQDYAQPTDSDEELDKLLSRKSKKDDKCCSCTIL